MATATKTYRLIAAKGKCRKGNDLASGAGRHTIAGLAIYEFYIDVKYFYDCNSVNRIKITGATGKPLAPGWSFKGTSARTEVVKRPNQARAKSNFTFKYKYGPLEGEHSSCLGINVTVTKYARVVDTDLSCRANP